MLMESLVEVRCSSRSGSGALTPPNGTTADAKLLSTCTMSNSIIKGQEQEKSPAPFAAMVLSKKKKNKNVYMAWGGSSPTNHTSSLTSIRLVIPDAQIKLFVEPQFAQKALDDLGWMGSITVVPCAKLAKKPYASKRFECYQDEIETENADSKVAIVDLGDVWFLQDIFEKIQEPAYVVAEPEHWPMSLDKHHKRWINDNCAAYGPKVWNAIQNNSMVCAGTMFGTASGLQNLLMTFNKEIQTTRCNDQGVLNVLVRTGRIKPTMWYHEEGVVLSMNIAKEFDHANAFVVHTGDNPKAKAAIRGVVDRAKTASEFRPILTTEEQHACERVLLHIKQVCNEHGIHYMMDGGTLIGSLIHHGPIPWDDDIDILIDDADREMAIRVLNTSGYIVQDAYDKLYSKIWDTTTPHVNNKKKHNWPFVDIGWLERNATHAWEKRSTGKQAKYSSHVYPLDILYPTVERPFGNLMLSAPRDGAKLMSRIHGTNWRQQCVKGNWDHKLERIRDKKLGHGDTITKFPCSDLPWVPMVQNAESSSALSDGSTRETLQVNGC